MKKIIIIGSSIGGASAACLLSKHANVIVYEQKAKKDIGEKLCANVVTPSFLKYSKIIGINPKKCIISTFNKAIFLSPTSNLSSKINEFKIDRPKLILEIITLAQKNGARVIFNTEFSNMKKIGKGYLVVFKNGKKEYCDILIGADGALSNVAKKAGLWNRRKFILTLQTEIPSNKLKGLKIEKNIYNIYVGKKYGHYGYIFPSKNKITIGMGGKPEKVRKKYYDFLKSLKIKKSKIQAALIPFPQIIPNKKNLFLIGDAACQVKFSGGGIVPAMMAAESVNEIILNNNFKKMKILNKRTFFNRLATKLIFKLDNKDFDYLVNLMKEEKFLRYIEKRDEFSLRDYLKLLDLRILKLLLKLI